MKRFGIALAACAALVACSGTKPAGPASPAETEPTDSPERAIGIVRTSFEKMGGLERLRLSGGRRIVHSKVSAGGESFATVLTLGGPEKWRLDYTDHQVSYVYADGQCRKIIYGYSVPCTQEDAKWTAPAAIYAGLVYPAQDAANLGAGFKLRPQDQRPECNCDVVEIKLQGSSVRLKASFGKSNGLLQELVVPIGRGDDKTTWTIRLDDWQEVDDILTPTKRTIAEDGSTTWTEEIDRIELGNDDNRPFLAPQPSLVGTPFETTLPRRRVIVSKVAEHEIEQASPPPTIGGAPRSMGEITTRPETPAMAVLLTETIGRAFESEGTLLAAVKAAKRTVAGPPDAILLQPSTGPDDPGLVLLYVSLTDERLNGSPAEPSSH